MAQILYGAQIYNSGNFETDLRYDAFGKNSEVITFGDPLTIASGVLAVAGTTNTVVGIAAKTQTMTSTNQTVAKVVPGYIPVTGETLFLMGTNADLTGNGTDGGTYYKLSTGTTALVQVDVTSGVQTTSSRVVEIVEVDPFGIGGTGSGSGLRQVVVRFVKTPYSNVTITA